MEMENFIELIRERPALWDTRTDECRKHTPKKKDWNEVAEAMNEDWSTLSAKEKEEILSDLQHRWKNTRDYFRRRHFEMLNNPKAAATRKSYIYADNLEFLIPVFDDTADEGSKRGKTPNTKSSSKRKRPQRKATFKSEPVDENEKFIKNNFGCDIKNNEAVLLNVTTSPPKKTHAFKNTYDMRRKKIKATEEEQKNHEEADRMFLLSLLPSMADIPPYMKMKLKIEILEVIHNNSQQNLNDMAIRKISLTKPNAVKPKGHKNIDTTSPSSSESESEDCKKYMKEQLSEEENADKDISLSQNIDADECEQE